MQDAEFWIKHLALQPHPEGGYFKETYRAARGLTEASHTFPDGRNYATAIYFLLESGQFSAFHRLKSDEVWHFYEGSPLRIYILNRENSVEEVEVLKVGRNFKAGERLQAVVPANHWFAAQPEDSESYSLVGCTMAPGFDFQDFEMASREFLLRAYPQHEELIKRFTLS